MTEPMLEDDDDLYGPTTDLSNGTEARNTQVGQQIEAQHSANTSSLPGLTVSAADNSDEKSTSAGNISPRPADSASAISNTVPDTRNNESIRQGPDSNESVRRDDEDLPGLGLEDPAVESISAVFHQEAAPAPDLTPDDAETALAPTSEGVLGPNLATSADQRTAEYEADSSPYETSSDDSSDSSSEDDSSDDDYPLMDPREQARMLMADAGSDDEGGKKEGRGKEPRTQNEHVDEIVEMPDLTITPDMVIEELGSVQTVVDNVAVIKGKVSGAQQVLETSSVLCLEDRSLIGVVAETIGRVEEPMYVVRFTNPSTREKMGVEVGRTVYYLPSRSHFLFTRTLNIKGSDASNLHDEEVADNEIDFSDDEAEAAYKASLKKQRQAKKEAKSGGLNPAQTRTNGWNGQQRQSQAHSSAGPAELTYDDNVATEDMYTPLSRPTNILQAVSSERRASGQSWVSRGAGRSRGRGGNSGRGRGNFHTHNRGHQPGNRSSGNPSEQNQVFQNMESYNPGLQNQAGTFIPPPPLPPQQIQGYPQAYPQGFPYPQPVQQNFATGGMSSFQHLPPPPQLPPGAHVNPGFFLTTQGQQQQNDQQQQQHQQQQHQQSGFYNQGQSDNRYGNA